LATSTRRALASRAAVSSPGDLGAPFLETGRRCCRRGTSVPAPTAGARRRGRLPADVEALFAAGECKTLSAAAAGECDISRHRDGSLQ
jgi:hypothetical protein